MQQSRTHAFGAIDVFRLIAAVLVVTIHTSPLITYSDTADFLLTRVLARVAVPFFLMTTGFFTLGRTPVQKARVAVIRFYRRTLVLYAVAMGLYLPLNVYNGTFLQPHFWPNLLKDLFLDGTFYHLWYLPASLIGVAIVQLLQRCRRNGVGWAVVLALYVVGLLGDSYYGAIAQSSVLKTAYEGMFTVFDYTRNGLFYAPAFVWMGAWLRRHPLRLSRRACGIALSVCLLAMCGEALSLRAYGWQRHDSMYLLLLPVMLCLFSLLLRSRCQAPYALRELALAVYLIHPWMIVCVRGAAKVLGLTALLIDNSVGHFVAVTLSSLLFAGLYAWCADGVKRTRQSAGEPVLQQPAQTAPEPPTSPLMREAVQPSQPALPIDPAQGNVLQREGKAQDAPQEQAVQTQPAQRARTYPPRSSRRKETKQHRG